MVGGGEPNAYYDPAEAAKRLTDEQRSQLPAIVEAAEARLAKAPVEALSPLTASLLHIAVRVQPGIIENAAQAWAASLVASLSRHPVDLIRKAINAAEFKQFGFVNEVGPFLEGEIAEPLRARRAKVNRLRMVAEQERPKAAEKWASDDAFAAIYREVGFNPRSLRA